MKLTEKEAKAYEFMVNDFEREFLTGDMWNREISSLLEVSRKQATGIVGSLVKKGYLKVHEGEDQNGSFTQYSFPKDK